MIFLRVRVFFSGEPERQLGGDPVRPGPDRERPADDEGVPAVEGVHARVPREEERGDQAVGDPGGAAHQDQEPGHHQRAHLRPSGELGWAGLGGVGRFLVWAAYVYKWTSSVIVVLEG